MIEGGNCYGVWGQGDAAVSIGLSGRRLCVREGLKVLREQAVRWDEEGSR